MMIRVIYKDQTAGVVESHLLDSLIRKGRIVAYHSVDRWVPVESRVEHFEAATEEILKRAPHHMKYNTH